MASISMLRAFANGEISSLTEEAYSSYKYSKDLLGENLSLTEAFQKSRLYDFGRKLLCRSNRVIGG